MRFSVTTTDRTFQFALSRKDTAASFVAAKFNDDGSRSGVVVVVKALPHVTISSTISLTMLALTLSLQR